MWVNKGSLVVWIFLLLLFIILINLSWVIEIILFFSLSWSISYFIVLAIHNSVMFSLCLSAAIVIILWLAFHTSTFRRFTGHFIIFFNLKILLLRSAVSSLSFTARINWILIKCLLSWPFNLSAFSDLFFTHFK